MLTINIWIEAGLVNGVLGKIIDIIFSPDSKPPEYPLYVTTRFDNYNGPPWNINDPKVIQIIHLILGS